MAKPPQQIDNEIRALGEYDSFGTKKEIKYLPEVMREAETIKALGSGFMDGNTWLLCVTDQRLLFLDKGMIMGLKQTEIPLASVTSVNHKTGLLLGSITITAAGKDKKIDQMAKQFVAPLASVISDLLSNAGQQPQKQDSHPSEADELAKFAALRDKGILTNEEFEAKKNQILGL